MYKCILTFVILPWMGVIPGHSQTPPYAWKTVSSCGYTYRYVTGDPMHARFYTLENGLTVMLSVNHKEPRIQTMIGVRAGSNNDPGDHTGMAHYLEHLLFKGTDKFGTKDWAAEKPYLDQLDSLYETYDRARDPAARKFQYHLIDSISGLAAKYAIAGEYDKMMADMGSQGTNAYTWAEGTVYEEDIPSHAVEKYLTVEAERFRYPVFRLFHTELEAVYEEKNSELDDDEDKVYETELAALFPTTNYGLQPTIGTVEHLKNPSLKAIRSFYNTWYVPGNMGIVMVGDFNPDLVIRSIDRKFRYMRPVPITEYCPPPEAPLTRPVVKEVFGPEAENVTISYRMPGALDTRDAVMLEVLSQVLQNGEAGLLDLNITQRQKMLSAQSEVMTWKDYSVLSLTGKALEGQSLDQVKDLLLDQVDQLRKGRFDVSLMKAIFNNTELSDLEGLGSNATYADALMEDFIRSRGRNWAKDLSFADDMGKVTKQQVIDFAGKYLNNNYVLIYKRKGEDTTVQKIEKPAITPVPIDREARSAFFDAVAVIPETNVKPRWIDYARDIRQGQAAPCPILYVRNKDSELFHLYYRFEMGTLNDRRLALAVQYLTYLGTGRYTPQQVKQAFYSLACYFDISSEPDVTTVSITGLQANFGPAVRLFDDLILHCKPDQASLTALKDRICKSRQDNKQDKESILAGMTQYAMYGPHNPFNYQLSQAELDRISAVDLTDLLHKLYAYKHQVIYYGPLPLPIVTAQIRKWHTSPKAFKTIPSAIHFDKAIQSRNQVLFTNYDLVQSEVEWVRNTTVYSSRNTAVISLFNDYFGDGMGSIVSQTIRESKALAYDTYAMYDAPAKKEGRYSAVAYIGCQTDKLKEAIRSMNALLNDMPLSEELLETARRDVKQEIETERITQDDLIFNYLSARKMGLRTDIRKKIYSEIDGLGLADIKHFHDENLSNKPYTYCILAPQKEISTGDLQSFGTVKELSLEEIFGY